MSELRKCMVPGCEKMVVEEGRYFCGEHERDFIKTRDKAGKVGVAFVGLVAIGFEAVRKLKK